MLDELDVPFDEALCWALASWTLQDGALEVPAFKAALAIKREVSQRWAARGMVVRIARQRERRIALLLVSPGWSGTP